MIPIVKVLVISKDKLVGESITSVLSDDKSIQSEAMDYDHIFQQVAINPPNIVLFPVNSFSDSIMKQVAGVKKEWRDAKLLLLMSVFDDRFIVRGLMCGVDGFLMDDVVLSAEKFQQSIHDLDEYGHIFSGKIAKIAMRQSASRNKKEQLLQELLKYHIRLSARELDVAYQLMQGDTNLDISIRLGLKENSVRDYVSIVYKKIGINKRKKVIDFLIKLIGEWEENGA